MHRLPLQKTLVSKHVRFLSTKKPVTTLLSSSLYKTTRPAIILSPTNKVTSSILAASSFHIHQVDKKAVRFGSESSPATPSEIEYAESTHKSRFLLVRICKSIIQFLDDWVLEPLLTVKRLTHILILFIPVAVAVPIVFFGQKANENERSGTLWWYDFLARQMERAGPTFIKVSQPSLKFFFFFFFFFFDLLCSK
jgi:aarF domain-containing kinase